MAINDDGDRKIGGDDGTSSLDEKTHAELLMLYRDSAAAARFAKERQWKLLGATLLLFAAIMALPELLSLTLLAGKSLMLISFLISASVIYVLIIYQFWQSTEFGRMQEIAERFSSVFAQIAGPQATREAKFHGYLILFFMMIAVILGNGLTALMLLPLL